MAFWRPLDAASSLQVPRFFMSEVPLRVPSSSASVVIQGYLSHWKPLDTASSLQVPSPSFFLLLVYGSVILKSDQLNSLLSCESPQHTFERCPSRDSYPFVG